MNSSKTEIFRRRELESRSLYGSAVTGEFHSKHSDLNLLCVLEKADAARIEALHAPIDWWLRQGIARPWFSP